MISFCIPAHDAAQLLPGTLSPIRDAAGELSLDFEIGRFRLIQDEVVTSGRKLRAYSLGEGLGGLGRLGRKGPRAMTSREGLDPWYGPRRPDRGI